MTYPHKHLRLLEAEARELHTGRSCARMLVGDIKEYLYGYKDFPLQPRLLLEYIAQQEAMYSRLEDEQKERTELIRTQLF